MQAQYAAAMDLQGSLLHATMAWGLADLVLQQCEAIKALLLWLRKVLGYWLLMSTLLPLLDLELVGTGVASRGRRRGCLAGCKTYTVYLMRSRVQERCKRSDGL